ncbi:MAG: GNAT family N-acetyltransferase [Gammaproteobacteria bacterium]|nr:GNAT family N-acetyltransferase [Gammaproteobacteria bacterium]
MTDLRMESLRGEEIRKQLRPLSELRIAVFHDWPYLYEGSLDYEAHYLETYMRCPRSLIVLLWDGDKCVGATTVIPLVDASAEWQRPFMEKGFDLNQVDYFGESVILKSHRGRGFGVAFFKEREAHARELNLPICAFCSVERPANHPAKPANYIPNDGFWTHRGYRKVPDMKTTFSWPDIGATESTEKPMTFWMRDFRTGAGS